MARFRYVKGDIIKTTKGKHRIFAKDNIEFISAKKVSIVGKEGGVVYGTPEKYIHSPLNIEEGNYTLESTYAHEQLSNLAEQLDEIPFISFMIAIFGKDIETSALSKLYRGLSDKSIQSPEIIVTKIPVRGRVANYSNHRKKILIWEHIIDLAIKDNNDSTQLLTILIEEYGHHIDNLLRTDLATNSKKDEDYIDEGAKFAYALSCFDIFKESSINYAKVQTPKFSGNLIVDFSEVQDKIKAYSSIEQQYDAIPNEDLEAFGAGFQAGMHGGIEREALSELVTSGQMKDSEINQIYYGNWLRDYSQVLLESTIHLEKDDVAKIKKLVNNNNDNKHLKDLLKTNAYKMTQDTWVKMLEILAAKEFSFGTKKYSHYENYLNKFRENYGVLTRDILGIYRPEEHIDNPKGLNDFSSLNISFQYEYEKENCVTKKLYNGEEASILAIDPKFKLKNYIHIGSSERPCSDLYMQQQLKLAVQYGRNKDGFRHLGAALHVLEDYFSHTNFVELSLCKIGEKRLAENPKDQLGKQLIQVYPWVQSMQGKKYTTIPIVTGKFLKDDTMASVLPKVGEKMFPIEDFHYIKRNPGDRTFMDAFIVTMLEDLSTNQKSDGVETETTYMGKTTADWLKTYNTYLKFMDAKAHAIKEGDDFFDIKNPLTNQKIDINPFSFLDRSMSQLGHYMGVFANLGFNLLLSSTDEDIKEEQTLNSNKNYGTDPTHTQIAKDATNHPLNPLASELAKVAVKDVVKRVLQIWKTGEDATGDKLNKYVVNKYTLHPKDTNWADKEVIKWINTLENTKIIERLQSESFSEHTHKEVKRVMEEQEVQQKIKKLQEAIKQFR